MTKNEYLGKIKELETLTNNIAAANNIQEGDGDIAKKDPVYITTKEEYEEKFKHIWCSECDEEDEYVNDDFKGEGLYDGYEWSEERLVPVNEVIEIYQYNVIRLDGRYIDEGGKYKFNNFDIEDIIEDIRISIKG